MFTICEGLRGDILARATQGDALLFLGEAVDRGIDAVLSPTRRGPAVRTRQTEIRYIGRETLAYLYWKAFHRSADHGPSAV